MPSGVATPLVVRSSSPCGCVTVIFVGGRASGVASSGRGRLRELRAGVVGFWTLPCAEVRRVEMVVVVSRLRGAASSGVRARAGRTGRTRLAMMLLNIIGALGGIFHFTGALSVMMPWGVVQGKTRRVRGLGMVELRCRTDVGVDVFAHADTSFIHCSPSHVKSH